MHTKCYKNLLSNVFKYMRIQTFSRRYDLNNIRGYNKKNDHIKKTKTISKVFLRASILIITIYDSIIDFCLPDPA